MHVNKYNLFTFLYISLAQEKVWTIILMSSFLYFFCNLCGTPCICTLFPFSFQAKWLWKRIVYWSLIFCQWERRKGEFQQLIRWQFVFVDCGVSLLQYQREIYPLNPDHRHLSAVFPYNSFRWNKCFGWTSAYYSWSLKIVYSTRENISNIFIDPLLG